MILKILNNGTVQPLSIRRRTTILVLTSLASVPGNNTATIYQVLSIHHNSWQTLLHALSQLNLYIKNLVPVLFIYSIRSGFYICIKIIEKIYIYVYVHHRYRSQNFKYIYSKKQVPFITLFYRLSNRCTVICSKLYNQSVTDPEFEYWPSGFRACALNQHATQFQVGAGKLDNRRKDTQLGKSQNEAKPTVVWLNNSTGSSVL